MLGVGHTALRWGKLPGAHAGGAAAQPRAPPGKNFLITFYNHKWVDLQETIYLFFITKKPLTSCRD
jgi:hypothetical protein